MNSVYLNIINIIFPARCVYCRAYLLKNNILCLDCKYRIVLNKNIFCGKCGSKRYKVEGVCHKDYYFQVASASRYEDPILREVIYALKFEYIQSASEFLAALLFIYIKKARIDPNKYNVIIPMPLSSRRLKERGFNQSELIAKNLSLRVGLAVDTTSLKRCHYAPPQSGMPSYKMRFKNIQGAFNINNKDALKGKKVILIDDVITSGATILEASKVLLNGGAKEILALTVLRA